MYIDRYGIEIQLREGSLFSIMGDVRSQNFVFEIATDLYGWWLYLYKEFAVWKMIAPLVLIVGSNCFYHICAKSVPDQLNTFGALTITYLVGAILSAVLFVAGVGPSGISGEIAKINWAPIVLGIAIIGLEAGNVLMYRAGWPISTGALVANTCLAIALLVIGALLFKEGISPRQVVGIVVCAVGLFLVTA